MLFYFCIHTEGDFKKCCLPQGITSSVDLWDLCKLRPHHHSSRSCLNRNTCNIATGVKRALLQSGLWVEGGPLCRFHSSLHTADHAVQPTLHPWESSAAEAKWWEGNWWNPVVLQDSQRCPWIQTMQGKKVTLVFIKVDGYRHKIVSCCLKCRN